MPSLFHPDMLERLADFFPATITIQYPAEAQDPVTGEITVTWTDLPGHVGLTGSHGPNGGQEVKLADQTYVVSNYTLALSAIYTSITEKMRAVVDGTAYEILLVQHNSHSMKTRLLTRKVT